MSQMLDLIKRSAVPAAVMRSAAKGALSVSPAEMLEILVFLTGNPVFGQEARMTLAGWDQPSAISVVSGSEVTPEVLQYFWSAENRRPALMPALVENPRLPLPLLAELAGNASPEIIAVLLASSRVKNSPQVLRALMKNDRLDPADLQRLKAALPGQQPPTAAGQADGASEAPEVMDEPEDPDSQAAHATFVQENAAEIASEAGKSFELVGDEEGEASEALPASSPPAAAAMPAAPAKPLSVLQKLARMTVDRRIKAAFNGGREERMILIRDGSRMVQNAVLASPRLSESEVESFAAAKNVQENVLREIARNRKFIKSYIVVRNLVANPKCPLDISLTLVKNLTITDLKHLQTNKNVPDTVRKVATKLYKQKLAPPGTKVEA